MRDTTTTETFTSHDGLFRYEIGRMSPGASGYRVTVFGPGGRALYSGFPDHRCATVWVETHARSDDLADFVALRATRAMHAAQSCNHEDGQLTGSG